MYSFLLYSMSKSVSLSDEAYELLKSHKGRGSFSEVILKFFPETSFISEDIGLKVEE